MPRQHRHPCSDCPWRRVAIKGWLGSEDSPEAWCQIAHSETWVECHKRDTRQCAGMAIFRANVFKSPRFKEILILPPDTKLVFANDKEFIDYHRSNPVRSWELED